MLGTIIGDLVGSRFEFNNIKSKNFNLFDDNCSLTDDSYMTLAVCNAFLDHFRKGDDLREALVDNMQMMGRKYPNAGYGNGFKKWLLSENPAPYNSYGNGSAMRVSSVAYFYNNLDDVLKAAEISAEVTHNHPEGIKGAKAIAGCTFLARQGALKDEIKSFAKGYYSLDFKLDEIRDSYEFYAICQQSVPQAIVSFLEGNDYEDVIRNAVSIGGDSDTIAAMAGSIAEPFFTIDENIKQQAAEFFDEFVITIIDDYKNYLIEPES